MTRYTVTNRIRADREDPGYRAHVEHNLKHELGMKLVEELPLDEPTMVRIRRDESEPCRPRSKEVPGYITDRAIEIRYEFELTPCRSMDQIVLRPVYRDPEPEIRYVDREVPFPVYVKLARPTFWQRVTDHVEYLCRGVQYDGGYGEVQ